ncbi:MAG: glycosyltransferase [Acidobacteriaceae bacterium]|nr:glycosyltransferase [Acidobacteriaceae bacterium]
MKIVIFGLSVSSSWGNGHATLWRGLLRALHERGHELEFFERDTPYYARWRDVTSLPYARLQLYSNWEEVWSKAKQAIEEADAGVATSYCPDGIAACELLLNSKLRRKVFYDMDTPVTLSRLEHGELVDYLPASGLAGFDLVLSYTGGRALELLRHNLSARRAATLYGWVDPATHHRVQSSHWYEGNLSYLGTYSADRQKALQDLFFAAARLVPECNFVIGGAMYPDPEAWPKNIRHYHHVGPPEHCAFYSSSPLTLNVTRASMAAMGYCPSGRLFEAAATGTAVLSDWWEGLDCFFKAPEEILIGDSTAEAIAAIKQDRGALEKIGERAKQRTLDCHTAKIRARRFIELIEDPMDEHSGADAACLSNAV